MDQSKPNEDHGLHSPNLPENLTPASFNFYNSHYLAHQPENSQCPSPLSHQNSSITVPYIQHHQSHSVPELAPNVPSQQISYRHELICTLSQQQKLLQYQSNYGTQKRQLQPHYQNIRQQLSDIRTIQLPNSQHAQIDPPMNSETQASIYQTELINFESQQRPVQHPLPHALSAEITQPPEYTRETLSDDSDTDNLELELQPKEDRVKALTKKSITNQIKISLLQQCKGKEQRNQSALSRSHQTELEKRNITVTQAESNIANLNLILGSSNKTAQSLHAENEILSSNNEGLNPQVQILQKTNSELNAQIRVLTEENLGIKKNRLSVEKFLRYELQNQNPKAADILSKITNLKLELDISNKTANGLRAQNEILSSSNENLNKQVQTLQRETQHRNAEIGTLTEQNLGIKKTLALSTELIKEKDDQLSKLEWANKKLEIQQQIRANEQVIKQLRIENNELPCLKEKMESLTNLQKKTNNDKEELDKEVEGYKKEVTSLSNELEKVNNQSRLDLEEEKRKMKNTLKDAVNWNENLQLEVTNVTDENQNLNKKVNADAKKHKKQVKFLFSIIKSRKNVLIDLRNKNQETTVSSSKTRLQYRKLLESNQEYEQTLAAESATIQKTLKENVELKQELANEKINAEQNSKYTSKIKNMAKEVNAKNEVLATELGQLRAQLNNKSKRNIELQMEKDSSNKTNTEHCSKIQELTRKLRVQGATNENNLQEKQREIDSRKVQIHNQKRSLESHKSKISELQNAGAENFKKLKMTEDNVKHQLKGLHAYFKSKEIDWKAYNSKLEEKLMTAKEGTKNAKKENEMQNQTIQEMEMKMTEVHAENKEMEKRMSELRAKNKELQCKNEILINKETIERLQEEQIRHFETTIKGVGADVKVLCSNMTLGADSNPECRLGVRNRVVPKDDCKVRIDPLMEGFRSAITASTQLANGNNHRRYQALHPVPLMSLKLPCPITLTRTTLFHERQQGDIDHPYNISKMNRINGDAKHGNDKNGKTLKRQLCNEEADLTINLVKGQLQQETQLSRDRNYEEKNKNVASLEVTAVKKNQNDCEYPPKKRICVDERNIPRGLDDANGLDELEEGEIP